MAEVTRRRTGEFLRKLFEILLTHSEPVPARGTPLRRRLASSLSPITKRATILWRRAM